MFRRRLRPGAGRAGPRCMARPPAGRLNRRCTSRTTTAPPDVGMAPSSFPAGTKQHRYHQGNRLVLVLQNKREDGRSPSAVCSKGLGQRAAAGRAAPVGSACYPCSTRVPSGPCKCCAAPATPLCCNPHHHQDHEQHPLRTMASSTARSSGIPLPQALALHLTPSQRASPTWGNRLCGTGSSGYRMVPDRAWRSSDRA